MTLEFEQVKDLVELAIIIIAFIAIYKSVPAEKVAELRQKAGDAAPKTATPLDDILLEIYDFLQELKRGKETSEAPLHNPSESRD